jgi:hypothetical protein
VEASSELLETRSLSSVEQGAESQDRLLDGSDFAQPSEFVIVDHAEMIPVDATRKEWLFFSHLAANSVPNETSRDGMGIAIAALANGVPRAQARGLLVGSARDLQLWGWDPRFCYPFRLGEANCCWVWEL